MHLKRPYTLIEFHKTWVQQFQVRASLLRIYSCCHLIWRRTSVFRSWFWSKTSNSICSLSRLDPAPPARPHPIQHGLSQPEDPTQTHPTPHSPTALPTQTLDPPPLTPDAIAPDQAQSDQKLPDHRAFDPRLASPDPRPPSPNPSHNRCAAMLTHIMC